MEDFSLPEGVHYEVPYTPIVAKCTECGKRYRIDTEQISGVSAGQLFKHCVGDEGTYLFAPLLGVYEECHGKWITTK